MELSIYRLTDVNSHTDKYENGRVKFIVPGRKVEFELSNLNIDFVKGS